MAREELLEMLKDGLDVSVEAYVYSDDLSQGVGVKVTIYFDGEVIASSDGVAT